jgi:DNA helicase-2/ATP-dependent DNA helicase PcrA
VNGSHADDLAALIQVAAVQPDAVMFEPWLRETLSARSNRDGVRLASVHRVKGLEFDHVLALGVHRPHDLAVDVEEERRIAHVAITRARRDAHVLAVEGDDAPFLDEMAGREPVQPARAARVRAPVDAPAAAVSDRETGRVVEAKVGVALTIEGGDDGEIVEVDARDAKIAFAAGGWTRVKWGAVVRADGERATLEPPGFHAIVDGLSAWRAERASRDRVPPYVVMHNSTRDGIARARPTGIVALGRCPGIGPTKLERYGDDILVVIEQALAGAGAADAG